MTVLIDKQAFITARLTWIAPPYYVTDYDVVRGDLNVLLESGGDFTLATEVCLADGIQETTLDDAGVPEAGTGYWYLVRAVSDGQLFTYDSEGCHQAGSRDVGVSSASGSCP